MEEVLREQLKIFLHLHSPGTSLSSIDGIFLSYLSEIISDLSDDDSELDATPFTDMITAYVPEFGAINRKAVCEWVHSMALMFSESSSPYKQGDATPLQTSPLQTTPLQTTPLQTTPLQATPLQTTPLQTTPLQTSPLQSAISISPSIPPPVHPEAQSPRKLTRDRQVRNSEQEESTAGVEEGHMRSSDQIELMADIFPGISKDRIKRALHRCQGNIDECVQVLLDGTERNHLYQEIPEPVQEETSTIQAQDCEKLKSFITSRYSLVDTREDVTIHRPVEPKWEGKKMVRYRDNHVVSTRGERFLVESKKEENQSNAKTSYIRPLRRYRFH